jgi:hypothetical protein
MNRQYSPTSRLLRCAFVVCAVTATCTVAAFIDLLASHGGAGAWYAARPAGAVVAQR